MIEYENLHNANKEFFEELQQSFSETLKSGWFILGDRVKEFENAFAEYCGITHCIGVASGLDALFLSLKVCDFETGSEVIVPSNTYVATILSILHAGLTPVMAEPEIRTYNLDPKKIEERISNKTKAIMPVHLYGKLSDMQNIVAIAKKHNLVVIEDCAQAHGATFNSAKAGTFGSFGAFSFYPTKNLGALGDGGAVVVNNDEHALSLRRLRNYGSDVKYYNEITGFNSRLDEVQAAFLNIKLKKLEKINEHKRKLAAVYQQGLKNDFIKPHIDAAYKDVYHIYAVRHQKRDHLKKYLLDKGIKTEIHYPVPPYKQKAMQHLFSKDSFPVSDEIHSSILSLPISYFHTEDNIAEVVEVMNKF